MIKAEYCKHTLKFKFPAGTSRGVLKTHEVFIVKLFDDSQPQVFGLGEAAPLYGLSIEFGPEFENNLKHIIESLNKARLALVELEKAVFDEGLNCPASVRFALETAIFDLKNSGKGIIYKNAFTEGGASMPINGLIWMGHEDFMARQIEQKLDLGFETIKMKIGAIDFETEYKLLKNLRKRFPAKDLTLRVDANGAFGFEKAKTVLQQLAELEIHSIEQPIAVKQYPQMAELCANTPLPIALDEELIGVRGDEREKLIEIIKPQFLIFKPTLLGGFNATKEWIDLAKSKHIGWWMTSALESNIGLNAIAQFTFEQNNPLPQGLGTGQLYENNFESPLSIIKGEIWHQAFKREIQSE